MTAATARTFVPGHPPRQAHAGLAVRGRVPRLRRRLDRQRRAAVDPAPTCTSRCRACSGCSAATCSPTAASCCSAAAPPTCSAAAGCSSPERRCSRSSSLAGGLAGSAGMLVGARLAQGVGAAMMLPAALSILTTTFSEGTDRHKALGAWGAMAGLASAAGVFLGGVLSEGPGWRWVFFVNLPVCALVLVAAFRLLAATGAAPAGEFRHRWARSSRPAACCCWSTPSSGHRTSAGARPARSASSPPRSRCSSRSSSTSSATETRWSRSRSSASRGWPQPTPPS